MSSVNQRYTFADHLLNITFLFFLLAPQNNILYFGVPVLSVIICGNRKIDSFNSIIIALLTVVGISAIINVVSPWFQFKAVLKALELVVLLYCFCRNRSIHFIKEYLIFALLYLFAFQICDVLNISFITQLKTKIYPLDQDSLDSYAFYSTYSLSDIGSYSQRLGSIYYNSNNFACVLEFLLSVFIIEKNQFGKKQFILWLAIFIFSLLLAGSRTSFLVLLAMLFIYVYKSNGKTRTRAIILGVIFIFAVILYGGDMRMFKVSQGMNDSFGAKTEILKGYLGNVDNILLYLFGSFDSSATMHYTNYGFAGTDFDFGNMIVCHGFLFALLFILFLYRLFKTIKGIYLIGLCPLLWGLSNTVVMNYRVSAIFFLLAGIFCLRSLEESRENDLYISQG